MPWSSALIFQWENHCTCASELPTFVCTCASILAGTPTTMNASKPLCPFLSLIFVPVTYIRVNNPTLNRNIGKFQLNHIWDRVLFGTPNIKVANPTRNAQHSPWQLYKLQHLGLPLDLRKSRVLDETLSMFNQSSVWTITLLYYAKSTQMLYAVPHPPTLIFEFLNASHTSAVTGENFPK